MKSGKLFWGLLLLTIGGLVLSTKYDLIMSDFSFVWDIWPLLFIFWGAMVIAKNTLFRPIISAVFGVFVAVLIFGLFYNLFSAFDFEYTPDGNITDKFIEEYNPQVTKAFLTVNTGAAMINIHDNSDQLLDGYSSGSLGEYYYSSNVDDSVAWMKLELENKHFNFIRRKIKNYLELNLNSNPVWDLELNIGATKSKLDLSELKISDLSISTGASTTTVRLGDKYELTNIRSEMGVGTLNFEIPSNSGCSLSGDMVLTSKDIDGFVKKGSNRYETENYDSAENIINIRVDSGVSSINIKKY